MNSSKYSVEAYDPAWPIKFRQIESMLREIFGNRAIAIEHVGSTSIPGMKAKPIIDVLVVVEVLHNLVKEKESMLERGYQFQENYIAPNTYLFRRIDAQGNKRENIHVCEKDSAIEKQFLVKRDYLRAFPEEAKKYIDFKEELARKFPNDYESYRAAKTPFLNGDLEQKAYQWKLENS